MREKVLAFSLFLLSGCGGMDHLNVPTNFTYDRIRPISFLNRGDLAVYCLDRRGWFTRDNRACMVQRTGLCEFVTAPGDTIHSDELKALCNGWRPYLKL